MAFCTTCAIFGGPREGRAGTGGERTAGGRERDPCGRAVRAPRHRPGSCVRHLVTGAAWRERSAGAPRRGKSTGRSDRNVGQRGDIKRIAIADMSRAVVGLEDNSCPSLIDGERSAPGTGCERPGCSR